MSNITTAFTSSPLPAINGCLFFQLTNAYDTVYKWVDHLNNNNIHMVGYVIMPNHVHVLLYFPKMEKPLNTIVGNAKRFTAYEIIKRLEQGKEEALLDRLHSGVKKTEKKRVRYTRSLKIALMRRSGCSVLHLIYKPLISGIGTVKHLYPGG